MNLLGKKILVTGADGFIGSHLTEELLRSGYSVRAFVLYNSLNSWGWLDHTPKSLQDNLEVFPGDIRDPQRVLEVVKGCQVIFHLAALVAIPYSYHALDSYVDTNIKGTLNILKAARNLEAEKVVHTSTSEVYGTARFIPINEEHPLLGQSPYSATKIAADQMALSFYHSFETPVAVIRPFNTYGPRQSARAVIPTVITQIAGGQRTIQLGSTFPTRDFSYVKDTISGLISAAETEAAVGEVINLGTGFEISIGALVQCIAELMQAEVEIESEPVRIRPVKSEVERLLSDNGKAKKLLGWEPEYAGYQGLQKGLAETITWFSQSENLNKYRPGVYNL